MNPVQALLNSFDRLINERGSSAILRERLALAADKYANLEAENQILKTENQNLKIENTNLNEKIKICEDRKKQVEEKIKNYTELDHLPPPSKPEVLDPEAGY